VHGLEDTHLGTLLSGYPEVLLPGESFLITQTVTVSTTTINRVTWTAYDEDVNSYEDSSYAIVTLPGSYYVLNLPVLYRKY
jgi:hypothetical protein